LFENRQNGKLTLWTAGKIKKGNIYYIYQIYQLLKSPEMPKKREKTKFV